MKRLFCILAVLVSLVLATPLILFSETPTKASLEIDQLHKLILYPTTRIRVGNVVGSGVVFASVLSENRYNTFILTNFHVVEGAIQLVQEWDPLTQKEIKKEKRGAVEVELFKYQHYSVTTGTLLILADIIEWNADHDLALLQLRSDEYIQPVKLLPREQINNLRVFQPVFVCGAGLGRSPFPTIGTIASLQDEIDNLPYWMLNAPSVFGNSGGGAFLADSKMYIGIPSRIAVTFANWAPNAVYHMNYIIPISRIYDWLDKTGRSVTVGLSPESKGKK